MRSGLLAFGVLLWAAPVFAQSQPDPLSPLPSPSAPQQGPASLPVPAATTGQSTTPVAAPLAIPQAVPAKTIVVPKDWRGVFDAIDAGQWASAQAGIAALPKSILTPVAKAELYTARGSPVVDLDSLRALIAEAP